MGICGGLLSFALLRLGDVAGIQDLLSLLGGWLRG